MTLSATAGGGALDLTSPTAYTLAQATKFYHDGVIASHAVTNKFQSVKDALLSAANGGGASLHNKTKLSYPYLQAVNISGATMNATNLLDKIFDGWTRVKKVAKGGNAREVVMGLKHLGSAMKLIEAGKGGFKVAEGSRKASIYGWEEVEIMSVTGDRMKLVGVQEMDEDVIFYIDWSALVFRSNGFFKKRTAPDGKQYHEVRNTTGYSYILDVALFGELEVNAPSKCGVIHSIPAYS